MADLFEKILWTDWLNGYWIETVAMHQPILYIRVDIKGNDKKQPHGDKITNTGFFEGDDGYTYVRYRPTAQAEEEFLPIYMLKKGL